jgi:hypothetical protein
MFVYKAIRTLPDKTVAGAGTAEPLSATELKVAAFTVQALGTNTGNVYIGDENVSSSQKAAFLAAGELFEYDSTKNQQGNTEINLAEVYIDVDANGEGVCIGYTVKQ